MQRLYEIFSKVNIPTKTNEPLKGYTTFHIGGCAPLIVFPKTTEQVIFIIKECNASKYPLYVLGQGSNLLISDRGLDGVVLSMRNLNELRYCGSTAITQAGVKLFRFISESAKRSLSGVENLFGIPGSIGGSIRMNCGAYGTDIASKIRYVDAIHLKTGQLKRFLKKECMFAYRQSVFQSQPYIITGAAFSLISNTNRMNCNKLHVILKERKRTQPYTQYCAGSIFKKPTNGFAAKMIEDAGLKGLQIGDALVSTIHAGFIINQGKANSSDVINLIKIIKRKVFEKYGINLNCEIEIWGENDVIHE